MGTFGPALNVEPSTENYMPISILYQYHVDIQFNTINMVLDIDDFEERFIHPACVTIGNTFDTFVAYYYYQNVANRGGVPGTRPTSYLAFSDARATLVNEGMMKEMKQLPTAIVSPLANSAMADSFKGLFNPQARISEYFETGEIARKAAGADWYEDPNVAVMTTGTLPGTPVLGGITSAAIGTAFLTSGWLQQGVCTVQGLGNSAATLFVGDTIQIAGIFPVNPQSRTQYGTNLKSFVVLPPGGYAQMSGTYVPGGPQFNAATLTNGTFNATTGQYTSSSSNGKCDFTIGDAIITGGQFQNCKTGTAFTGTPAVTWNLTSPAATTSTENAYFHRDSLAAVMVDLPLPRSAVEASRATDKDLGISIRVVTQYTINNDAEPTRMDIAFGIAPLYRQLGYRVSG